MNNLFTIDCGEILLREFRIEDADAIYELTSQPEVYEFLPDWRSAREQRLDWVTNYEIPDNQDFLANVPSIAERWLGQSQTSNVSVRENLEKSRFSLF